MSCRQTPTSNFFLSAKFKRNTPKKKESKNERSKKEENSDRRSEKEYSSRVPLAGSRFSRDPSQLPSRWDDSTSTRHRLPILLLVIYSVIVVACVFNSWLATSFNGLGPVFFISSFRNASLPVSSSHSGPRNAIVLLFLSLLCPPSSSSSSLFRRRGPVARRQPRLIERIKESSRKFSSNHAECRLKTAQRERWLRSSIADERRGRGKKDGPSLHWLE